QVQTDDIIGRIECEDPLAVAGRGRSGDRGLGMMGALPGSPELPVPLKAPAGRSETEHMQPVVMRAGTGRHDHLLAHHNRAGEPAAGQVLLPGEGGVPGGDRDALAGHTVDGAAAELQPGGPQRRTRAQNRDADWEGADHGQGGQRDDWGGGAKPAVPAVTQLVPEDWAARRSGEGEMARPLKSVTRNLKW